MDAIARIELYNNLFFVFAGVSAVGFLLSVFFFFHFDIPRVYALMTGKLRKKDIQKVQARNTKTGRSRTGNTARRNSAGSRQPSRQGGSRRKSASSAERRQAQEHRQPRQNASKQPQTRVRPETGVLKQDAPDTMLLQTDQVQTVLLSKQRQVGMTEELSKTETLSRHSVNFLFKVTETTISINTNEVI